MMMEIGDKCGGLDILADSPQKNQFGSTSHQETRSKNSQHLRVNLSGPLMSLKKPETVCAMADEVIKFPSVSGQWIRSVRRRHSSSNSTNGVDDVFVE